MPELPDVEMERRAAERACKGKTIEKVYAAKDDKVYAGVSPKRFASALQGRAVQAVCRHGKQLWFELDRQPWPLVHFGMTGGFAVYHDTHDRPEHCKCEWLMDDGTRLGYQNTRRIGGLRLQHDPLEHEPIRALGFDPYTDMPSLKDFTRRLRARHGTIKGLLLNQGFAAGVGNWIADEVLYQARIDPRRRADRLSDDQCRALRTKLGRVVRKAVEYEADPKRFPASWLFPHRGEAGEAEGTRHDHEGHPVKVEKITGRTTSWVPARQS